MTVVKRTRLSPEQRRAQLIDLGEKMLAERPIEQISVEDIADQAGVSPGLLFHYFASKHDFHLAIVRHASDEMLDYTAADPAVEETGDPIRVLRSVLSSFIDYASENRACYVSLSRGTANGDPDMREIFEQTRVVMCERVLDQLRALGIEPTPAVALSVRGWIAYVEEVTITWLHNPLPNAQLSRDELIDIAAQALPALAVAAAPEMAATLLSATAN
ncbi:TetR family transcriptional regulator [Rhodococcus sp. WMMA185]|uniref:TetR/AcrR family transcriptional regulator n=1 Tax=Rhodococcus sp. WMMA185 TaxID=679318 RepID=UPI000878CC08|nr:TetR/AcrR family transcriptional regulator [Rhodococcus sp. WMMA185]AOW91994.1 TetR family transcriptional regulator [Rhodococcus sp. WMMA185]